jgi:hypothetical protein
MWGSYTFAFDFPVNGTVVPKHTGLIIVKDCILLSLSVGWYIDGAIWVPIIRENYFVASFSHVWNNSFPQPCKVTNERYPVLCIYMKQLTSKEWWNLWAIVYVKRSYAYAAWHLWNTV